MDIEYLQYFFLNYELVWEWEAKLTTSALPAMTVLMESFWVVNFTIIVVEEIVQLSRKC